MAEKDNNDANKATAPSAVDANEPQQVQAAESSPETIQQVGSADPTQNASFEQQVESIADKASAPQETKPAAESLPAKEKTAEPVAPASDVQQLNKTGAKPPEKESEFGHLPFHQHEDFKKLINERKELRSFQETAKPSIERLKAIDDFCQQNGVTPQMFKDTLEIAALLTTNPAEAVKRLAPINEYLNRFSGQGQQPLPADLQADVEAGTLSEARARQIVALQEQKTFTERRSTQTQMESRNQQVYDAIQRWEENIRSHDPEFEAKKDAVKDRFSILAAQETQRTGQQFLTPDAALRFAKQAYDETNKLIERFVPKPAPTKNLSTTSSVPLKEKEPTTWEEVEEQILTKYAAV